jgi:AAA family ATP:ADP antiporter
MEYQFTSTILHFVSEEQLKEHFANVYSFTNFVSLLLQLSLVRFAMTRLSMGKALLLLPLTALIGEVGFVLIPGLFLGSLLNTFNNSMAYSVNQSAKEALYVPMQQQEKYKAKAVIDIFILRIAKAVAVALGMMLTFIFHGVENLRWLSLAVFVLLAVWMGVVRRVGPLYQRMILRHA